MSLKIASIPITDEATDGSCTQYYLVRYRRAGSDVWQNVIPNPIMQPVTIERLDPSTDYDAEITRVCCNGQQSAALTVSFTTPS